MTDDKLINAALKAFGIDKQYVLGSRIDGETGEAVIVTVGGAKVRYSEGDDVTPLTPVRITGISPKKPRPITGVGKKKAEPKAAAKEEKTKE